MAIHTFGEYMDFHPTCTRWWPTACSWRAGLFYVLPDVSLKPLEELFRRGSSRFWSEKGLFASRPRPDAARLGAFRVQCAP